MLTVKQEKFCQAWLRTGNASAAYRQAYDAQRMQPQTVNRKAIELTRNGRIAARMAELQTPVVAEAQMTLAAHLERLAELADEARDAGQFAAAITAETNRGKAAGFYREKVELTGAGGGALQLSDADLAARMAGLIALAQARKAGDAKPE